MCELEIKINTRGQALLPLLILVIIVLSLGTAAIELAIASVVADRCFQEELIGFYTVEAALENGLLRILRNPGYSGESLQIGGVPCTISVSGDSPFLMVAYCDEGRWVRRMKAEIDFIDGEMEVSNIREIE